MIWLVSVCQLYTCLHALMTLAHFPQCIWLLARRTTESPASHVNTVLLGPCRCILVWPYCSASKLFKQCVSFSACLLPWSRGADLSALVREAAMAALKEHMQLSPKQQHQQSGEDRGEGFAVQDSSSQTEVQLFEGCSVATHHFDTAFRKVKASVSGKVAVW